jgi:hypothetical protein
LLSSIDDGVIFEVNLPLDQLEEETISANGIQYISLSIPGWSQTAREGEPKLPKITETLGIPFGVDYQLEVVPGKKTTRILNHPVLPGETQSIDWEEIALNSEDLQNLKPGYKIIEDKRIYESNKPYPGPLAEVTGDGVMRHQRVIGVSLYPIQYLPGSGELILYETIRVTIKFSGFRSTLSKYTVSESAVFEDILEGMLLNYDSAINWREEPAGLTPELANRSTPWTPPDPGWRVLVREEGFYQLGYDELASAGLPVDSLDPATFQLFHQGSEVAIQVEGEGDGTFDSSDYVLFYGEGIESKYTADNVYWLTYGKSLGGLRMETRDVTPDSAEVPLTYQANNHLEINDIYLSIMPGSESLERWMWKLIDTRNGQSWSTTFSLVDPYPNIATLRVALLGYLNFPMSPDHHVKVYLETNYEGNFVRTFLGEAWWDGLTWEITELQIDEGLLVPGENTITVECPNDTGVGVDLVYVDWMSLDYQSGFSAFDDKLLFSYEESGNWNYEVEGFTTNDVMVYDVTDSNAVVKLIGGVVELVESEYTLQFEDSLSQPKKYWTMTDAGTLTVQAIEQDTTSSLQSLTNNAEHLIIAHHNFSSQAETLRDFRKSQGLVSMWVDVQDIYDEFNFGIVDVHAIRNFLAYTIDNWDPYPSYVLLFGDGHFNPKGYKLSKYNAWEESYISPYLAPVDPDILETAADNRYVTLVGEDILPDMMLGRLAVNNTEEASAVVEKIITYETTPPPGDWREQIMAVTDNPDNAGNFYLISDNLLNCCLPGPFTADKVYFKNTHLTEGDARAAIQAGINAGKLIVNYIGHASTSQWAGEGLFKRTDIASLSNSDRMPIMLPMTCMDGYYINPGSNEPGIYPSIAETITRIADKGAIASWSPTGWGNVSGHDVLNRGFFNALFQSGDGMMTLGMATQAGKIDLFSTGTNQDLMDTYLLFGDPATRIAFNFTAVNDDYVVGEDNILDISGGESGKRGVLINDIHPQNLPLTVILVENVTNGKLVFHFDGSFTYTPNPNYFGTDSFTYYASDGEDISNIAVVEITISAVDEKIFLPIIIGMIKHTSII